MTEIESLKQRIDRLEDEREQDKKAEQKIRSEVEELRDRLKIVDDNQPDNEKEQLRGRVDELEEQNKHSFEENTQIKQRVADPEAQPEITIEDGDAPLAKVLNAKAAKYDVQWCEEEIEELAAGLPMGTHPLELGEILIQASDLTPIEQLSRVDDVSDVTDSPTVKWTVALLKNIADWGFNSMHRKMIWLHEQSETFERVVNVSQTASSAGAKGQGEPI